MNRITTNIVIALVSIIVSVNALGEPRTWYNTLYDSAYNNSFNLPGNWHLADGTVATEFYAEDDYISNNGMRLSGAGVFPGKSLHIGSVAENLTASSILVYSGALKIREDSEGFFFEDGKIIMNRSSTPTSIEIKGPVTVRSPQSKPFMLATYYNLATMTFVYAVTGESNTGMLLQGYDKTGIGFVFSDVSGYNGLLTTTSTVSSTSSDYGVMLKFKGTSFPGGVDLGMSTVLQMDNSVKSETMTLGSMVFRTGSKIVVGGTAANHGNFVATSSAMAEPGVKIKLDFTVPISFETNTLVLLSAPVGHADFTKDDFILDASLSDWKQVYHLDTVVADGVKSLVAVFEPLIEQTGQYPKEYEFKDTADCLPSSMTNASYWSDGQVPHGGMRYAVVSRNLRTPYEPNATGVFAGACLILEGGNLRIFNSDYTITNLIAAGGALQTGSAGSGLKTIHSDGIFVCEGKTLSFETYLGRGLEIDSEITGSGDLVFRGISRSGATSSPGSYYILRKPNENFFGTVRVSQYDTVYLDFASKFQTLRIADGRCLGGTLSEFNPEALFLGHYSRLTVIGPSVELETGRNRGVYIEGCGRFYVDKTDGNNDLLVCNWPITLNGALYKEGSGRLELGGAAYFQGEDSIGDTPRANSNLFFVAGGSLMPRRHDCCDGMAMSFSSGTKLVIPIGAGNAELAKYGLYNAKEGGSMAIDGKLDVELDASAAATPPSYNFTVGLVTVTNTPSATAAVRGKLNVTASPYSGYRAKVVETLDPDNDVVVFAANVRHYGMILRFL